MASSGSGSYRVGGSYSSSSLSPLAPPFKVDKFLPKSNSMNPSMNFSDVPMYGTCIDPAPGQFWNSSSSSISGPHCAATESVVTKTITKTNCSSSPNKYGYRDSQSSTLPASVYYGSTSAVPAYDPFSYDPFPNSLSSNTDGAAKPYYPSYVSPPPQKDGNLGLGVGSSSGSGYDLLSYSVSAHMSGGRSAQVDHQQVMSGDGEYKPKWGFIWNELNENDHEKWTNYAQGFASKDSNTANVSGSKSHFVDGGTKNQPFVDINVHPFVDVSNNTHLYGDVSSKSHLQQGACLTQDSGLLGQVSTVKDKCFDVFGGAYSLGNNGIDQQDCNPSSKYSRMRTPSASVSNEIPHLQDPVLESVTSFCGSKKANVSFPDFSQAGFYTFGCASNTSNVPITMSKVLCGGNSSSVESTASAAKLSSMGIDRANQCNTSSGYNSNKMEPHMPFGVRCQSIISTPSATKLNSMGTDAANRNPSAGYNSCYQMEPQMPLGFRRQSSIRIRRPVSSSKAAPSCQTGENADSILDDKGAFEKLNFLAQLPHQISSDDLNKEVTDFEAVYYAEKNSGGSEGYNPAEDSPCWKGASSNRFSPFGHSESVASDVLVKTIDRCISVSSQDLPNKTLHLDFYDANIAKDLPFGKVNEVTSLESPSVFDCTSKDNKVYGSVNPKIYCFDLNAGDGVQFSDDFHSSSRECNMTNKSKADSDPKISHAAQLVFKGKVSSTSYMSEAPPSEKSGNSAPVAAESLSDLPSNIDVKLTNSHPGNLVSLKSASENSDSRIDVNVLLRTMMNLSETFRCYCFSNKAEAVGKHSVAIKQIISNLNASMSMITGQAIPTMVLSSPDTFFQREFPVQMVKDAEALAASVKLGRTTEDFLNHVSVKNDRNPYGDADANITEGVKKLISENLQEEEIDQQKLYKNLWLEAEASLCVMTAKARFLCKKAEMQMTHDGTKDEDELSSSNVSTDLHRAVDLETEDKDSLSKGECPKPTTTSQHNHIEEFHVPNSKVASLSQLESESKRSTKQETSYTSLYASRPGASGNDNNDSCTTSHANDVETSVMARYQILKNRLSCSDSLNYESKQSSGEHQCPSNLYDSGTTTKTTELESSIFGGYQILKCRDDKSDCPNYEGQQLPGDENYLPGNDSSSPDKLLQDSQMSNSLGVADEREASVMARFRIIQSRMDHSDSMINDSALRQASAVVVEDETEKMDSSQLKHSIKKMTFGPYPEMIDDEDVNLYKVGVNEQDIPPILKTNRMSSVILEGWYDNDCSSSDWEHISSRDVGKQC